jgi:hypothetical protein
VGDSQAKVAALAVADHPRARYRVVIERTPATAAVMFATVLAAGIL